MNLRRTFAARKFAWLEAISVDSNLTALDCRLAIRISRYLNWKKHCAWPSQERLANDIDCTKRAVQFSLRRLSNFGYLKILSGSRRAGTNRYFIEIPPAGHFHLHETNDESPFAQERSTKSDLANSGNESSESLFALNLSDNQQNETARVKARASSILEENALAYPSVNTAARHDERTFAIEDLDHEAQELDGYFIYEEATPDEERDDGDGSDILR